VNLAGGELRGGEIGAVILSAEISEAVKCGAPARTIVTAGFRLHCRDEDSFLLL